MEHSSTFYSFFIFNIISNNKNGVQNVFELYTVERLSTIKNTISLQLYNLLKLGATSLNTNLVLEVSPCCKQFYMKGKLNRPHYVHSSFDMQVIKCIYFFDGNVVVYEQL